MSITLTRNAASHVKNFLSESDDGDSLRIKVKPTGCSGYMYIVEPTTGNDNKDHIFETKGSKVVQLMFEDSASPDGDQAFRTRASLRQKSTASTSSENDCLG